MARGSRFGKYGDFKRKAKIREVRSLRLEGCRDLRAHGTSPVPKRRSKRENQQ